MKIISLVNMRGITACRKYLVISESECTFTICDDEGEIVKYDKGNFEIEDEGVVKSYKELDGLKNDYGAIIKYDEKNKVFYVVSPIGDRMGTFSINDVESLKMLGFRFNLVINNKLDKLKLILNNRLERGQEIVLNVSTDLVEYRHLISASEKDVSVISGYGDTFYDKTLYDSVEEFVDCEINEDSDIKIFEQTYTL